MTTTGLEDRLRAVVDERPPGIAVAIVDPDGRQIAVGTGRADLTRGLSSLDSAPSSRLAGQSSRSSRARATASRREPTSSLRKTLFTWVLTVLNET